jgi:hypothetical protein
VGLWLEGKALLKAWHDTETASDNNPDLAHFNFRGDYYDTLEQLALAMAASDEAWQAGAKYLARGYVSDVLKKRGQFDDENTITCCYTVDPNELVFRFIHTFAKDIEPVYRGLALTIENIYSSCISCPYCESYSLYWSDFELYHDVNRPTSVSYDFVNRTINGGWTSLLAFLHEKGNLKIQDDFLNLIHYQRHINSSKIINNVSKLKNILECAFNPDLFYWGVLPIESLNYTYKFSSEERLYWHISEINLQIQWPLRYAIELNIYGQVYSLREFDQINNKQVALSPNIVYQLSEVHTLHKGVESLKDKLKKE